MSFYLSLYDVLTCFLVLIIHWKFISLLLCKLVQDFSACFEVDKKFLDAFFGVNYVTLILTDPEQPRELFNRQSAVIKLQQLLEKRLYQILVQDSRFIKLRLNGSQKRRSTRKNFAAHSNIYFWKKLFLSTQLRQNLNWPRDYLSWKYFSSLHAFCFSARWKTKTFRKIYSNFLRELFERQLSQHLVTVLVCFNVFMLFLGIYVWCEEWKDDFE